MNYTARQVMIRDWWRTISKAAKCYPTFMKYKQYLGNSTSYRAMSIFELELLYELHHHHGSIEQATASIQIEMMFDNYVFM